MAGGYAHAFGPFALGGAVKLYAQDASANQGFGATGDIGALITLPYLDGIRFGAVARNLIGSVKFESGHTDNFDQSYVLGLSVKPLRGLTLAADYDITHSAGRVGAEYQIIDAFAARVGATVNADKQWGFTAGAGLHSQASVSTMPTSSTRNCLTLTGYRWATHSRRHAGSSESDIDGIRERGRVSCPPSGRAALLHLREFTECSIRQPSCTGQAMQPWAVFSRAVYAVPGRFHRVARSNANPGKSGWTNSPSLSPELRSTYAPSRRA